jgi:hypothetical protein
MFRGEIFALYHSFIVPPPPKMRTVDTAACSDVFSEVSKVFSNASLQLLDK